MLGFLVMTAAVIITTVFVSHFYRKKDIAPKAQLVCDVWKVVEKNEEKLNTNSARIHVVHYSYPG